MPSRRSVLIGLFTASVAGCVDDSAPDPSAGTGTDSSDGTDPDDGTDAEDDGSNTDDSAETHEPSNDEIPDPRGPVGGENDVDLETTEVETDDEVEYLEEDDEVRYVAAWRHTNRDAVEEGEPPEREPVYETTPFDRWSETQCLSAAATAASEYVAEELGIEGIAGGITSRIDDADVDRAAIVTIHTSLDRDGDLLSTPDVSFEDLVAATPATVRARYELEDRSAKMDVPIYAQHVVEQLD